VVLLHVEETLDFFVYYLHNVLWHYFSIEVFKEFLDLLLLLILLIGKVLLETLIDLL
jgi:hypothetical protein